MKELLEKIICLVGVIATTAFLTIFAIPLTFIAYYFLKYSFVWVAFLLYKIFI
jgi:hypothetical protein